MKITQPCVVALTWTLTDSLGEELDVLEAPVEFLVGGNDLLPAIEAALQELDGGTTLDLQLEPEQAFGDFDAGLLFLEPRHLFPAEVSEGMTFEGSALPPGTHAEAPRDALYTITDIYPEHLVLDGNHPLCGIALRLHLRVHAVRAPSTAEIDAGSAGTGFFRLQIATPTSPTPPADALDAAPRARGKQLH